MSYYSDLSKLILCLISFALISATQVMEKNSSIEKLISNSLSSSVTKTNALNESHDEVFSGDVESDMSSELKFKTLDKSKTNFCSLFI